ncbi:MAG: hypothetical protein DRI46_13255 [Chloroflexi bacterium]|nr:MAG: hypothetical protein DRI46_13255 [Chloroflexota bacterium]
MAGATGVTRANQNRAIKQEALRAQLAAGGHIQHVLEISEKLLDLDGLQLDSLQVTRMKAASDIKMRIIDKYLASLKAVEHQGEIDSNITIAWGNG